MIDDRYATAIIRTEDGKIYKICTVCGSYYKSEYGINFRFSGRGCFHVGHFGFCGKCAKKYIPLFSDVINKIIADMRELEV